MTKINKYNGLEYDDSVYNINTRKKLMLLGDDIRFNSGISTMGREIVMGTSHQYNWVQLAGSITHPEKGKIVDMSKAMAQETGIEDAYTKLYPVDGYGNEDSVFAVMQMEKPDMIILFTDPRYWFWFFILEKSIRCKIPIAYINIWDNYPLPLYNKSFYETTDLLMSISKQTYNINKWVLRPENCITTTGYFDKEGNSLSFE